MKLFDTHCHLFMEPLQGNLGGVLERSKEVGVKRVLVPSVDASSMDSCIAVSGQRGISVALGVHPWWAEEGVDTNDLEKKLLASGACALGEIGLDWKSDAPRDTQTEVFTAQLQLALKLDLPVILHCRSAFDEMLEILGKYPVRGAVHAWSRSPELMERFLDLGLFVSFGGAVTRSGARNAARSAAAVPFSRFVLETDAPSIGMNDLPSGETEPRHVIRVAEAMALHMGLTFQELTEIAWENSLALFGEEQ